MAITASLAQVTNAEDWVCTVGVFDADGVAFDLTGYSVEVRVTTQRGSEVLSGSTSDGTVTLVEDADLVTSIISWVFRAATMAGVQKGQYTVGVRIAKDSDTVQIILGRLPVLDGGFN